MNKIEIPEFETKKETISFLKQNKESLMAQKKGIIKWTDPSALRPTTLIESKEVAIKENMPVQNPGDELKVKVVINTTNIMDSHNDVHLPGLWNKSLSENKSILHLQEHTMKFDHIISQGEDLKAFTQMMNWSDLGEKFAGLTEALIFDSNIRKSRNEFMLEQYANGFVKQHSVGMRYIQLGLALNDTGSSNASEFESWEKYFPEIVNQELAEQKGFFWFVKEAKVVEGSAVILGSNQATPTLDNNLKEEPTVVTPEDEPSGDTQKGFFDGW